MNKFDVTIFALLVFTILVWLEGPLVASATLVVTILIANLMLPFTQEPERRDKPPRTKTPPTPRRHD